jgi:DNA-binding response OmpR family regulator
MVTAHGDEPDRVVGLEGGADDYIVKRSPRASCSRGSARRHAGHAARSAPRAHRPGPGQRRGGIRSIDFHVSHLRQKLGDDPRNPRLLKTVRGVGYMLATASPSETSR